MALSGIPLSLSGQGAGRTGRRHTRDGDPPTPSRVYWFVNLVLRSRRSATAFPDSSVGRRMLGVGSVW